MHVALKIAQCTSTFLTNAGMSLLTMAPSVYLSVGQLNTKGMAVNHLEAAGVLCGDP